MAVTTSKTTDARNICVNKKDCKLRRNKEYEFMLIRKGAHILSNTRHLGQNKNIHAIRYTTKKRLRVCIVDRIADVRIKDVLVKLTYQGGKHSLKEEGVAREICSKLEVDGWYVTPSHPNGERLVLVDAQAALR